MPTRPKTESNPTTCFTIVFRLCTAKVYYWDLQQTPL